MLSRSHIGRDSGFSSKIGIIPTKSDGLISFPDLVLAVRGQKIGGGGGGGEGRGGWLDQRGAGFARCGIGGSRGFEREDPGDEVCEHVQNSTWLNDVVVVLPALGSGKISGKWRPIKRVKNEEFTNMKVITNDTKAKRFRTQILAPSSMQQSLLEK